MQDGAPKGEGRSEAPGGERRYGDMLALPYPHPHKRPPMPIEARAAQFAPFAALCGHDGAIRETARLTDERAELDEGQKQAINAQLCALAERQRERPEAVFTVFVPDAHKEGGAYVRVAGRVKRIDAAAGTITLCEGQVIRLEDVAGVEEG